MGLKRGRTGQPNEVAIRQLLKIDLAAAGKLSAFAKRLVDRWIAGSSSAMTISFSFEQGRARYEDIERPAATCGSDFRQGTWFFKPIGFD